MSLLPRLILVTAERSNGRWWWTVGLHWPCGCSKAGTGRSPLHALRWAMHEHSGGRAPS